MTATTPASAGLSITPPPPSAGQSLVVRISELVHACFSGIYIQTHEPDEALRELAGLGRREGWRLAAWDCELGLVLPNDPQHDPQADSPRNVPLPDLGGATDPLAVLRAAGQLSAGADTTLLVLRNFHRFLGATEILEALARQVSSGKHTRTFVVILAPVVSLPPEI